MATETITDTEPQPPTAPERPAWVRALMAAEADDTDYNRPSRVGPVTYSAGQNQEY